MERLETDDGGGGSGERPERNVNKAEYYIQQLNSNNAKKVALCLVLGFIFYHGLIHLRYGKSIRDDELKRTSIFSVHVTHFCNLTCFVFSKKKNAKQHPKKRNSFQS